MARMMSTISYGGVDFGAGLDHCADRAFRSAVKTMVGESVKAMSWETAVGRPGRRLYGVEHWPSCFSVGCDDGAVSGVINSAPAVHDAEVGGEAV